MKYPPTSNRVQIYEKPRQSVRSRVLFLELQTSGTCDIIFKEGGIVMRLQSLTRAVPMKMVSAKPAVNHTR
jgi:hypothetical protein